jgi:RNA polymerase sigma-70 factor (ECF subfamily)
MDPTDANTTNPALLERLGNWSDREAWFEFVTRYDPLIRGYVHRFRLGAELNEELCQRVWIDLARRMRTYRYAPGKTFRGWLRRLCQSRAIDLLRQRKLHGVALRDEWPDDAFWPDASTDLDAEETGLERARLLRMAETVQQAVRRRVSEQSWTVFWSIAVEGRSVRETAEAAGLTYFAAFAAEKRVRLMLRKEGERLLAREPVDS